MYKMIYDGVDISRYVVIEDIKRPLINISTNYGEIPGIDGLIFKRKKNNEKVIEIRIRLIEDMFNKNLNATKDLLNTYLVKDKPSKLELSDYPDRYEMAILDGNINFEKFLKTGMAILTFKNPSGIFYSKELSTNTYNKGNKDCPLIIEANISGERVKIIHKESLKQITINTKDFVGKNIKIDTELEEITIENKLNMKSLYFDSDFFYLIPGANSLIITGLSSIKYKNRARWL